MKVRIKDNNGYIDADWTIEDGVMVVSPKEVKFDVTKFKDGDVLTCGGDYEGGLSWVFILKGEIEHFHDAYKFAEEYVSFDSNDSFEINGYSDAIKWVRYATEEEKKQLFDKLADEGWEWKPATKELVKLKWKPKAGQSYYIPIICNAKFKAIIEDWSDDSMDVLYFDKGWCFKTKEECQAFCEKLNQAIEGVKP